MSFRRPIFYRPDPNDEAEESIGREDNLHIALNILNANLTRDPVPEPTPTHATFTLRGITYHLPPTASASTLAILRDILRDILPAEKDAIPTQSTENLDPPAQDDMPKKDIHYISSSPNFLAKFLKTVHARPEVAARVKSISFSLPFDSLPESGLLKLLKIDIANPGVEEEGAGSAGETGVHSGDETPTPNPGLTPDVAGSSPASSVTVGRTPSPAPKDGRGKGDSGNALDIAAQKLRLELGVFGALERVPLQTVLDIYVFLFGVCTNVEEITIPAEWAQVFRVGDRFPRLGERVLVWGGEEEEGEEEGGEGVEEEEEWMSWIDWTGGQG